MTAPGHSIPPRPGWWPRTEHIGVGRGTWGWESRHSGSGSGGYGWNSVATGRRPGDPVFLVGANASATTSVTIPTHVTGDLLVIAAYNWTTSALAVKPAAGGTVPNWLDIDAVAGGATNHSLRTAYCVAGGATTTSGVWTSGDGMVAVALRRQHPTTPIGGHAEAASGAAATSMVAPAITLTDSSGISVILYFYARKGDVTTTVIDGAPSGTTRRCSAGLTTAMRMCLNTKDVTTSDGASTQTTSGSSTAKDYRGATVEILSQAVT